MFKLKSCVRELSSGTIELAISTEVKNRTAKARDITELASIGIYLSSIGIKLGTLRLQRGSYGIDLGR